jgi:hypothetical protein
MVVGLLTRRVALAAIVGAAVLFQTRTDLVGQLVDSDDFGADSGGRSDASRALQNALDAAAGGTLRIKPGRYVLSTGLVIPPNTTVMAEGVTLTWRKQVKALMCGSGVVIEQGTIVGPGGGTYSPDGYGIACYGRRDRQAAGPPGYVDGPTLRGTRVRGWSYAGVYLGYLRNAVIQDCTIEDSGYCGIGAVSVEDVAIERNLIDGVGGAGAPDSYGIFADRLEGSERQDPRSRRVRIAGNTVRNVRKWEAIDTHGGEDFEIVDNTISGCRFGIAVVGSDINDRIVLGARRVTVANNTIEGSDDGAAIIVAGAMTGSTVNQYAEDCRVIGNRIVKGGRFNDTAEGTIRLYATKNAVVEGNTLDRPRLIGINLIVENRGIAVRRNEIKDVCDTRNASPTGIAVTSHQNTGSIEDNVFRFENTAAATYVAALGIDVQPELSGLGLTISRKSVRSPHPNKQRMNLGTRRGVSFSAG